MANWNVELPCQIGDTVYFVGDDYTGNKQINEVKVAQIKISDIGIYIVDNEGTTYSAERLYFSEEEAKKEFDSKPLTIDELRQMNGKPVYCVDNRGEGKWALVHTADEICTDADFGDWEFYSYGWKDSEVGWLAYREEKKGGKIMDKQMTDKDIIKAFEYQVKLANESNKVSIGGKLLLADVLDLINRQKAEIERYKGVIKILEKDVENERIDAQEFYNRIKVAEFEPIPIEIKDYAEGYNKAVRDVAVYMVYEYGVKPLSREQAEQALRKEDEEK